MRPPIWDKHARPLFTSFPDKIRGIDKRLRCWRNIQTGHWEIVIGIEEMADFPGDDKYVLIYRIEYPDGSRREPVSRDIQHIRYCDGWNRHRELRDAVRKAQTDKREREARSRIEDSRDRAKDMAHGAAVRLGIRSKYVHGAELT